VPTSASPRDLRPIRAETRVALVTSIARGRRWLDEIVTGKVTSAEQIAARDKCTVRQVNMTISLAFLAPDLALVASIARGRRWLDEIVAGTATSVEQIAARDKCSIRQVNMTISLAFLAPDLMKAAVEGRLPRGIGVTRLRDAPAEWSRQYAMLGLSV
jgi:hypothetical protein